MKPRLLNAARLSFALASAIASLLAVPSANAASLYWDSNGTGTAGAGATPTGTWGSSVFWSTDSTGANVGSPTLTATTTNADDLFFVAGPGAASGNNAYVVTTSLAQVANSLTFQASGGTTLSGGTSITLGDGTPAAGGIIMNQFAYGAVNQGAVTISTAIALANSQTWTNNSANALTFNGGLTLGSTLTFAGTGSFNCSGGTFGNAGSGGIVMNGSGTLLIRQATNTNYTGSTTINSGIVLLNAGSKSTGNFNLAGGMVTDYFQQTGAFSNATGLGTGSNQIQITGNSGFGAGNGTSTWRIGTAGSVLVWGASGEGAATGFFNPTTLKFMTVADNRGPTIYGIVNFDNGLNLNGATRTIDVLNASANPTNSGAGIAGIISNGSLIKTGGGNLNLNNAGNTYGGTTTISGGFLTVATTGALGSASNTLEFNGGALRATGTITSPSTRAVTMTSTGIIDNNGQAISIAGNIGGSGGLTKNSTGALTLSGTNTFGGVTTVNAGSLVVTKEVSLASNTAANLNVKSGATLQLNVDSAGTAGFTSASLSTLFGNISVANTAAQGLQAGAILALDTSTATGATFTLGSAITNSTGAFGGAIGLVKLGAGTLVVDQANTHTGGTTISAGTLQLNDGGSIPGTLVNNGILLVNKTGALTIGTDIPSVVGGSGSIAIGASSTLTLTSPTQFQFSALNTTGGGSIILSGVTTPVFGGLSGTAGNLSGAFSSGYSGVTNLILNTPSGTTFTYAGVIDDGAAGMSVTKIGAGSQILTGTNTYTGSTFLNGGTLQIGSGATIGRLSGTTGLTFNGGTLQFTRSTNANINAINDAAPITSNGGTLNLSSNDAGGASASEIIGAVDLASGLFNLTWTNAGSSGTTITLGTSGSGLTRSGATSTVAFSTAAPNAKTFIFGQATTAANQIIGPWATSGGQNGAAAQTDYATYNITGGVANANGIQGAGIAGSAETAWTTPANAYTMGANQTLTGTRTIAALRNTFVTTPQLTLASGFNLETYGVLNGAANATFTIAPGTGGVLTTPTGGGNIYLTSGPGGTGIPGAITVSAPINNNGGNVTLVKSGSGTLTLTSTTSNFSGGVVLNAGTLTVDDARSIGGTNNTGGSTAPLTVDGNSTVASVTNNVVTNFGTGAITLNNGATLTVSSSSRGDLRFAGAVTGSGGVTATSGSFWSKYSFTSTANTFTGAITDSRSGNDGIANALFSFNSIADGAGHGNIILNGATDSGIDYGSGAIAALDLNHRRLILANNNTVFFNNASSQAVNINTDIGFSGTGARQIRFGIAGRSGSGVSTFAGKLTDNAGGVFSPTFNGGNWVVSGNNNSYTGTTSVSGTGNVTFSGNNTLTGPITVSGSTGAILTLSGNNSGMTSNVTLSTATGTSASSPRLNINSATALGTGILNFGGGAATDVVQIDNTSVGAVTVSTANAITLNRNFTFIGTQSLNLGTGTATVGGITAPGARSITVSANTLTFGGDITEAVAGLGFTKLGTGSLTLSSANNSFSGSVTLTGGTTNVAKLADSGSNSSLGSGSSSAPIRFNGGTMNYNGAGGDTTNRALELVASAAINNNSTAGAIAFTAANVTQTGTASARTLTLGGSYTGGANTFASIIGNSGTSPNLTSLVKNGNSTWVLTGPSTYTGNTTVSAGTLAVTGSLGATAVSVNGTATLGGNGNIGGNVTIGATATHALAVAATPGAQVTRAITGTLTLTAGNILDLTAASTPAAGEYVLATATTAISGTPTTINYNGITGTVTVDTASNPNRLLLTVGGGTPYSTWAGGFLPNDVSNPALNFDSDNLTNLQEFAFGTNPTSSTGSLVYVNGGTVTTPGSPVLLEDGGTYYAVFGRRESYIADGLTYNVQFSADLSSPWVTSGATPTVLTPSGAIRAVSVPFPGLIPTDSGPQKARFFRVEVLLAP